MDNNGYVMGGMAFLLVIPAVIISAMFINVVNLDETINIPIKSDTIHHISGDLESNIPILSLQVLKENSDEVVKTGEPISNSRGTIKSGVQSKIDDLTREYQKNTGINIYCKITAVDNSLNPYEICVNSTIDIHCNCSTVSKNISQNIQFVCSNSPTDSSIESYKIQDPLPFIKTKGYGTLTVVGDKINYGTALSNYLKSRGLNNSDAYNNASSPLYFKKCPYDPYHTHGNSKGLLNLKNCIENGYYHESSDGACIFCRLEGKSTCTHFGLETFIVPSHSAVQISTAPCSVDHVIFGEYGHNPIEIYPGTILEYYRTDNISNNLYLDNGHRNKYGLPLI